ncbi:unnamed protein product [Withania somnifera]
MEKNVQFRTSDTELITQLLKFVAGKCLPDTIGFVDVYSKEPWQLIGESSKKTHYFFTQLKKKKASEARFNRTTVGGGSWMQQDKGKAILDEDENLVIGYKKSLNYKHKKTPSLNGQWMMKEYFLADFLVRQLNSDEAKDFVICAVKNNPKSVIGGNSKTIASDDIVEYKRFIARVLPQTESTVMMLETTLSEQKGDGMLLHPSEPKDDGMLLQIHSDGFFRMKNQESYQQGDEVESDWLSLLDFEDQALLQNCFHY